MYKQESGFGRTPKLGVPVVLSFLLFTLLFITNLGSEKFFLWHTGGLLLDTEYGGIGSVLIFYIGLGIVLTSFVMFEKKPKIYWFVFLVVFTSLGYQALNDGYCITTNGIYQRSFGQTICYPFSEVRNVSTNANRIDGKITHIFVLDNGKSFSFETSGVDTRKFLSQSIDTTN